MFGKYGCNGKWWQLSNWIITSITRICFSRHCAMNLTPVHIFYCCHIHKSRNNIKWFITYSCVVTLLRILVSCHVYVGAGGSSVTIETGLRAGRPGFSSRQGQWWDFFVRHRVQTVSEAHLVFYPVVWGALTSVIKRPGSESDHSPPYTVEVKDAWSCTSTPQCVFMKWRFVKHRNKFTFTSYFIVCT
jgi:hypothetical protein